MPKIGFIGVGHMGGPMARNLIKVGHSLKVYDLSEVAVNLMVQSGAERAVNPGCSDGCRVCDYYVAWWRRCS